MRKLLGGLAWGLAAISAHAEMVVIREIMYHPPADQPEFFVLQNNTATPFDMAEWRITDGVTFAFPGFSSAVPEATFLKAFECIVISGGDASATRAAYNFPPSLRILGPWSGHLNNAGERVTVQDKNGVVVCTVKYGTGGRWPAAPDGAGHSLVLKNANGRVDDCRNWGPSVAPRAVAGQGASVPPSAAQRSTVSVRLNEIHFQGSNSVDWVELFNPLSVPASMEGLYLSSRRDFSDKIPLAGECSARGYRSWDVNFSLERGQIAIYLIDDSHTVWDCAVSQSRPHGESLQAFPDGDREWYGTAEPTRQAANQPARQINVVIHEIMCDPPASARQGEFVELFNRGETEVDLSDWRFEEGMDFTFPAATKIAACGFLVVARDAKWVRTAYGEIPVIGNFGRKLSKRGDLLRLVDERGNLADEVDYRTGGDWPELVRGGGSSLELIHPAMDNGVASAWRESDESRKAPWQTYAGTGTYLECKPVGQPSDYREMQFYLVGDGHVALDDIALLREGTNLIVNGSKISTNGSSASGWLCQGTHWASFITNGQLHLVSDGRGDDRANRVEIDVPGLQPNSTCELRFKARWISGTPRLIAQTWDHSFSHSFLLEIPKALGTPGRGNSQAGTAPAPQVDALSHSPAVPRSTNTVRVTARVCCAAPLATVQLIHRADSPDGNGAWASQIMFDDGSQGGDAWARDGTYTTELKEYGKQGQVVQFYVQAMAENRQVAELPRGGKTKPALYVVDNRTLPRNLRTVRLVVSATDLGAVSQGNTAKYGFRFPRLSNHYFNATFISSEEEIRYGGEMRNSGSALTRNGELRKPKLKLPADRAFRGRTRFGFDDDAAEGKAYHNRVVRYLLYLLGHPCNENEFVRVLINAGEPALREDTELVDNGFLDRNFSKGSQGDLYRIDDEWWFLDHGEGVQQDADWLYKGSENSGHDRAAWMKRTNEAEDDYSGLIALFQAMSATNSAPEAIDGFLDPQATLKLAAVRGWIGDWDNFTLRRGRNGYLYGRSTDGRFQFLHWDSDEGFLTGQPLYGERIKTWLEKPRREQLFYGYVGELLRICVQEPARLRAWLQLEKAAVGGNVIQADYLNFFKVRGAEVQHMMGEAGQLQSRVPSDEHAARSAAAKAISPVGTPP